MACLRLLQAIADRCRWSRERGGGSTGPAQGLVSPLAASPCPRSAVIMPNLVPPVTTVAAALQYKSRIEAAVPEHRRGAFVPLMTLYLTDSTPPEEVHRAKEAGVIAFKLYPAGATTNSASGVTDIDKARRRALERRRASRRT